MGSCCTETHSEADDFLDLLVQQLCGSIKLHLGLLCILLGSLGPGHKSLHLLHLHVSGKLFHRVCKCIHLFGITLSSTLEDNENQSDALL